VPERTNGAVSKTVDVARRPWVRIPSLPPGSGRNVEQALDNLRDVVEVYLEEEPAPAAPQPPLVTSFDVRVPA
jgi:hypothetical protein